MLAELSLFSLGFSQISWEKTFFCPRYKGRWGKHDPSGRSNLEISSSSFWTRFRSKILWKFKQSESAVFLLSNCNKYNSDFKSMSGCIVSGLVRRAPSTTRLCTSGKDPNEAIWKTLAKALWHSIWALDNRLQQGDKNIIEKLVGLRRA